MKKLFSTLLLSTISFSALAQTNTMIIIDAGSSGSKLYVYHYDQTTPNAVPTQIKTVLKNSATPGLQNINVADLPNYLNTLFSGDAKTTVAPVYFYSTAGMRVISPTIQQADYTAISAWISANTAAQVKDVRTITGADEAFYDWIADNELQNGFQSLENLHGILDMGGGSVEVAYPSAAQDTQAMPFKINEQTIYVHAQSYLGLGQDFSRYQYSDKASCYPVNYPMPDGGNGTGSAIKCQMAIKPLLTVHSVIPQVVSSRVPFDATSGFYYTAQTVMQASGNFKLNLLQYTIAATTFCAQDWNQMLANPKYAGERDYLYSYCYNASEHIAFLNALGLNYNQNNITAVSSINGNSVNWTVGILVDKALNP